MSAFRWRTIRFEEAPMHRGATCWVAEDYGWKAVQWREGDVWYARLRLGVHRFPGQGATAEAALDAAHKEASSLAAALFEALSFV